MVRTLSKERSVVLQVLTSRLFCVPIHWMGRSVMCAGEDCPACGFRLPRLMYYLGCQLQQQVRVLEVPSSFAQLCVEACNSVGRPEPLGLVIRCNRGGSRDCWHLIEAKVAQLAADPMSERALCQQLAIAYRVGGPRDGELFREWFERVRVTTKPVLRNAHLFA